MRIAIDGYNFIKQVPELRRFEQIELQKARGKLIEHLSRYKRIKGHAVTVVFDGSQERNMGGHREVSRGIEVIFSKPGEKADDVLKRLAANQREGIAVVTSDRELAHFVEKKGTTVIPVLDFAEKMAMADFYAKKGSEREPAVSLRSIAPIKKGPSRRLPKSKRKALATTQKI